MGKYVLCQQIAGQRCSIAYKLSHGEHAFGLWSTRSVEALAHMSKQALAQQGCISGPLTQVSCEETSPGCGDKGRPEVPWCNDNYCFINYQFLL